MNLARALTVTALAAGSLCVSYLCILYFVHDALICPGTKCRVDSVAPRPEGADLFHIATTDANDPRRPGANPRLRPIARRWCCLPARKRPAVARTGPAIDVHFSRCFRRERWGPGFLLRDYFDNLVVAKSFPGPLLVIHGRDDRLVPWNEGLRLAAASGHTPFRLYDCGHRCWDPEGLSFWRDVIPNFF
jgi:pimeloyl-ACP methyl ester carboxylesterase